MILPVCALHVEFMRRIDGSGETVRYVGHSSSELVSLIFHWDILHKSIAYSAAGIIMC